MARKKTPEQLAAAEAKKNATPKQTPVVKKVEEVKTITPPAANSPLPKKETELTYAEAEQLMMEGKLIKLPEWGGFWFANIATQKIFVYTKDGNILATPEEEYKDRNDWELFKNTNQEVTKKLEDFQKSLIESLKKEIADKKANEAKKPKRLTGEEAYQLLNEGKKLRHPNVPTGYIQMVDAKFKNFAKNGDFLGNVNFADLQDEEGWEETI